MGSTPLVSFYSEVLMPEYVYGCSEDKEHPKQEVTHPMSEDPEVSCEVCNADCERIPQPFRFYANPLGILLDWSDENWRRYRKGGRKAPKFSPDKVNRPLTPLPQKDFHTR